MWTLNSPEPGYCSDSAHSPAKKCWKCQFLYIWACWVTIWWFVCIRLFNCLLSCMIYLNNLWSVFRYHHKMLFCFFDVQNKCSVWTWKASIFCWRQWMQLWSLWKQLCSNNISLRSSVECWGHCHAVTFHPSVRESASSRMVRRWESGHMTVPPQSACHSWLMWARQTLRFWLLQHRWALAPQQQSRIIEVGLFLETSLVLLAPERGVCICVCVCVCVCVVGELPFL